MKKRPYLMAICLCVGALTGECRGRNTILLDCGDTFAVDGIGAAKPLRTLANALKSNRMAQSFRVSWIVAAPSGSSTASATYNRKTHKLAFYNKSEAFGLGDEGAKPVYVHWRLKRVSDAMIIKLARKHKRDDYDPGDSYFSNLTSLGAKKD